MPLYAQQDETGVGEIAGFMGAVMGVGAHVNGGFSFASPTSRHLVPNVELSYSSLGTDSFRTGNFDRGTINVRNSRMYDVNGGVHIRFPEKRDLAPYVGLGLGLLRFSSDLEVAQGVGGQPVVHSAIVAKVGCYRWAVGHFVKSGRL